MMLYPHDMAVNRLKRFFVEGFMMGFSAGIEVLIQSIEQTDIEAQEMRESLMTVCTDCIHEQQDAIDDAIQAEASALIPFYEQWIKLIGETEK